MECTPSLKNLCPKYLRSSAGLRLLPNIQNQKQADLKHRETQLFPKYDVMICIKVKYIHL